ncbi:MAG: anaerobic ribonucleoside-triphosphate reductase activating protein [Propionibacteriaceae bacterium]|nr:anaerobic ribonucleoside-triphosphate reductase activating protein [Propionibacteriaceae bacterium]
MAIAGLVPLSTCDWPGRLAATVFLQGCPWRCGYCHNPALIDPTTPGAMPWSTVRDFLVRRRGLLDGVVFSGGEPTRQPGLPAAVGQVKELGFGVGLHTAGAYPRRLAVVLPQLDWVGLDIKAPRARYAAITSVAASGPKAYEALDLVLASGVAHEVRVTVDPTVHRGAEIIALAADLRAAGAQAVVLQEARPLGARPDYATALAGRRLRDLLPETPAGVVVRGSD